MRRTPRAPARRAGQSLHLQPLEPRQLLAGEGFSAIYFNNADLTAPRLTRTDSAINFNWGAFAPDTLLDGSTFSVRWTGKISPAYTQTYSFFATHDDGVRVWVNNQLIIDQWASQKLLGDATGDGRVNFADFQRLETQFGTVGPDADFNVDGVVDSLDFNILHANFGQTHATLPAPVHSGEIALAAGAMYDVIVEYFEDTGNAQARLEWQSTSQARQVMPPATQSGPTPAPAGNGLLATYFNEEEFGGTTVSRIDQTIDFRWSGYRPHPRIESDAFSVRWEGQVEPEFSQTYTFWVNSDDGVRLWVNDQLILDYWTVKSEENIDADPIVLIGGERYNIKLEYFQRFGASVAELRWQSPSTPLQIVPSQRLYPTQGETGGPIQPPPPPPTQQTPGALKVSTDGRFLVKTDGTPFFWLADTAWSLFNSTTRADADYYLSARAAQEYTVIQSVLFNDPRRNQYGEPVFINSAVNLAYFDHADYILNKANELGLFVALSPTWGDSVSDPADRDFDAASAFSYGQFLGNRYKSQPNILWVLGSDWNSDDPTAKAIWESMAAGLQAGDQGAHLLTYHPRGGSTSSTWYHNSPWLAFNSLQSGHTRNSKNWESITNDWKKSPAKPIIDYEPNYENFPNNFNPNSFRLDDHDVRKKTYWALFAGAFGATYGNWEVYEMHEGGGSFPNKLHWKDALNYPGATQMKFARRLMQSRPYVNRRPDQSIITSSTFGDTNGNHIRATRANDGSYLMVYSAAGLGFTVNMTKITGSSVRGWWFNPRTGEATDLGFFANTGTQAFAPPSADPNQPPEIHGNDWILILDDASKGFGIPGGGLLAPASATPAPAASSLPTIPPAKASPTITTFSTKPLAKRKPPILADPAAKPAKPSQPLKRLSIKR